MSAETIIAIVTTIGGIAAAIKSIADARKARYEAAARVEAEKTTDAVIKGVERAKMTLGERNLGHLLSDEIKLCATEDGVEEKLNKRVRKIKATVVLSKDKLLEKLKED